MFGNIGLACGRYVRIHDTMLRMMADNNAPDCMDAKQGGEVMSRVLSNGPKKMDYVDGPFEQMLNRADRASLAAPYFTHSKSLVEAAKSGTKIRLLVWLNVSTSPTALRDVFNQEDIEVRYREYFHAKIYIFDNKALLGSANLSHNGLRTKREAVIRLDRCVDKKAVRETQAVFDELWSRGKCLTESTLEAFAKKRDEQIKRRKSNGLSDSDGSIDAAVNHADWLEKNPIDPTKPKGRITKEVELHQFYSEYIHAFDEIRSIIEVPRFQSRHMKKFHIVLETERFLNFINNSDELKKEAGERGSHSMSLEDRQENIIHFANSWAAAKDPLLSDDYDTAIKIVQQTFSTSNKIRNTSAADIFGALIRLHSFGEASRYITPQPPQQEFIRANINVLHKSLDQLLHGPGNFIARIYDVVNSLKHFGYSSAFELYGTVHPDKCPPINNRTVGVLNLLNFDVRKVPK